MNDSRRDQLSIDFTSRQNELLSMIAGLRNVRIENYTRGRVNGVVELLQRIVLFAKDLRDEAGPRVDAQVSAIAARISERRTVSERTVQRWTGDAKELGFVVVDCRSQQEGGHAWNRYDLQLANIRKVVYPTFGTTGGDTARHSVGPRGRHSVGPRGRHSVGPSYGRKVWTKDREPEPDPEAGPGFDFGLTEAIALAPALATAALRPVAELPPGQLRKGGAFAMLDYPTIRTPGSLVEWFRRQLALPRPVLGATEAHLILALATGLHCASIPAHEVEKNRTAIFIGIVNRSAWHRVLRTLIPAKEQLELFRDTWPLIGQQPSIEVRQLQGEHS